MNLLEKEKLLEFEESKHVGKFLLNARMFSMSLKQYGMRPMRNELLSQLSEV